MRSAIFLTIYGLLGMLLFSAGLHGCQPKPEPLHEQGEWVDLTYSFSGETLYWPTAEPFELDTVFAGFTELDYYYEAHRFSAAEHGGTHIDAPRHFAEGQLRVHELEIEDLVGPGHVIDVSEQATRDPDYRITIDDITEWEQRHGQIADRGIVLFRTGYGDLWPDAEQYMGTGERGEQAVGDLRFPGLHHEAAAWLATNRNVLAVGLDTPSIDYGQSQEFRAHRELMQENIPVFENVANLDRLPPEGLTVFAMPMKIRYGSGAPLRIAALVKQ